MVCWATLVILYGVYVSKNFFPFKQILSSPNLTKYQEGKTTEGTRAEHQWVRKYGIRSERENLVTVGTSTPPSMPMQTPWCNLRFIDLISKWPLFYYSFLSLQIGPFGLAFKVEFKRIFNLERGQKGQFAIKQKNTKMAAILE